MIRLKTMKHFTYILVLSGILTVGISSCVKEKKFPPEPKIEFVAFENYSKDSADCIINFKDGDGDVGIYSGDTVSGDDFKMKYFYKNAAGNFVPYDSDPGTPAFDTLFYSYRVPNLTPDGQYKALDGEIRARLRSTPLFSPFHDVVKFEITLRDRAGHISNIVTSSEITVIH